VKAYSTQIVEGEKYSITVGLKPQGSLELTIFEKSWTKTLTISKAKLLGDGDLLNGVPIDLSYVKFLDYAKKVGGVTSMTSKLRRKRARA